MRLQKFCMLLEFIVILSLSVLPCMSQISDNYMDNLTRLDSNDDNSYYMYEEEGITYFFDKDKVFINIISFYQGDEIVYGSFHEEDKIQYFDSDFNYITTSEWPYNGNQEPKMGTPTPASTETRFHIGSGFRSSEESDDDYYDTYKTYLFDDDEENDDNNSLFNKREYLGRYSKNEYDYESISNPYGEYGSPYSTNSINNEYGEYGSPYSSKSVNNPYSYDTPKLYAPDGTYLGKVSSNQYDYESISNPYGPYGSPYSPTSINNPYGEYGSPYSPNSVNNPYSTDAPSIYWEED